MDNKGNSFADICFNGHTRDKSGIWDNRQFQIRSGREQGALHEGGTWDGGTPPFCQAHRLLAGYGRLKASTWGASQYLSKFVI